MPKDSAGSDVRNALDALRRIVRALRLVAKSAETELGVTSAQLFVLQVVQEAGGATINEIAERTFTDQSSVSVIVTRMARTGFLVRERSDKDARRVNVSLTPQGEALLAGAPPTVQTRLIETLSRLPPERRSALATELTALASTVEVGRGPVPMFFEDAGRADGHPADSDPEPRQASL